MLQGEVDLNHTAPEVTVIELRVYQPTVGIIRGYRVNDMARVCNQFGKVILELFLDWPITKHVQLLYWRESSEVSYTPTDSNEVLNMRTVIRGPFLEYELAH